MLNRKVTDAPAGIELVRGGDGLCRADVDAAGAGSTAIFARGVGWEIKGCQDHAEKQPLTVPLVDHQSIFSLPTNPSSCGHRFFQDRTGVDIGLLGTAPAAHVGAEEFEAFEHEAMVVGSQGVFCNPPAPLRFWLKIVQPHDYDRASFR